MAQGRCTALRNGEPCGRPTSTLKTKTCRHCWRDRGPDIPDKQPRIGSCGHPVTKGADKCKACYVNRGTEVPEFLKTVVLTDAIRAALKSGPKPIEQLAQAVNASPGQALDALLELRGAGVNVQHVNGHWSIERQMPSGGLVKEPYRSRPNGRYRFGWISDTHLGSKYERLDVLRDVYRRFADADLDRIFHTGNWIDGEARFNRFDIHTHGMDAQVRYLCEQYPQCGDLKTYTIAGDDHEGWYCQREGVDIGKYAESEMRAVGRSDWVNLGYMEAFVTLEHATSKESAQLQLVHPGGGSAYATSYTVQKLVESYSGGSKPAVLLAGHYHKLEFINVRNVWCIQTGCTQDQTPFARKKRLHYALGGGICELEQDEQTGAIIGCAVQMWQYFDKGYYSGRWSHSGGVTLPAQAYGGVQGV